MLYAKISTTGSGFTNQIISIIYSIIRAVKYNHRVVVMDTFLNDSMKTDSTPISQIINLAEFNDFLIKKYGILLVDKECSQISLSRVQYVADDANRIDITKEIKESFLSNDRLFISKYVDFNKVRGDPSFGKRKKIILQYSVTSQENEYTVQEEVDEVLTADIVVDVPNSDYIYHFISLQDISMTGLCPIFEDILLHIHYSPLFTNYALNTACKLINNRTNVIHLRVEPDAITHWGGINKMDYNTFQLRLESKYIELIQKYMNKDDEILILSNSSVNGVVDFLIRNSYKVVLSDKYFEDREKNAIVDLLVSKNCNNIFLGCINNRVLNGSSFSYYISKMLDNTVTKVGIDIDNIYHPECVFH
jgi:hypothetical protein